MNQKVKPVTAIVIMFLVGLLAVGLWYLAGVNHPGGFLFGPTQTAVNETNCKPPCWEGITPGITTVEEVKEILSKHPNISKRSLEINGTEELGGCVWDWKTGGRWIDQGILWKDGVVSWIRLGITDPTTVQDVLSIYGLPEKVLVNTGGTPEHRNWMIHLYYPQKGAEFVAFTEEGVHEFGKDDDVGIVYYFSPTTMENWIVQSGSDIIPTKFYYSWKGFGDIESIYPEYIGK